MTSKKVNVSINPEVMAKLAELKAKLFQEWGFMPSYAQVIQYLIQLHKSK